MAKIDDFSPDEVERYSHRDKMPFGKHEGVKLIDVPARWLLWWYDQNDKKHPRLRAYIDYYYPGLDERAYEEKQRGFKGWDTDDMY